MVEQRIPRLALIVKSDSFEDLLLALSFAGIAASAGQFVTMFFTNRAARRLKVGGFEQPFDGDSVSTDYRSGAEGMGFRDLGAILRETKESGRVRVYLCSRGARIWDIDADSMAPEVDSLMGTATFLLDEVPQADKVITI